MTRNSRGQRSHSLAPRDFSETRDSLTRDSGNVRNDVTSDFKNDLIGDKENDVTSEKLIQRMPTMTILSC